MREVRRIRRIRGGNDRDAMTMRSPSIRTHARARTRTRIHTYTQHAHTPAHTHIRIHKHTHTHTHNPITSSQIMKPSTLKSKQKFTATTQPHPHHTPRSFSMRASGRPNITPHPHPFIHSHSLQRSEIRDQGSAMPFISAIFSMAFWRQTSKSTEPPESDDTG